MVDFATVAPIDLPLASTVSPSAVVIVQEPGGPVDSVTVGMLVQAFAPQSMNSTQLTALATAIAGDPAAVTVLFNAMKAAGDFAGFTGA